MNIEEQVWRIIGLVNTPEGQRVKLVKDESIGEFGWDTSGSNVNGEWGINEWSESDLMKLLNDGFDQNKLDYLSEAEQLGEYVNNSLYWTGGTGTCCGVRVQDNEGFSCDFTGDNKMPDILKNMIEDVTWNTGSNGEALFTNITANEFYNLERSSNTGKICDSTQVGCTDTVIRKTSWKGKVGLIYPSDYGYATSGGNENKRTNCFATVITNWTSSECYENDWLLSNLGYWTLTPLAYSSHAANVFRVDAIGSVYSGYAGIVMGVRPSVYLKPDVLVSSGDGSVDSPYVLSLE